MSGAFQSLLNDHAIAALDRQLHVAEVIGDRPWRVDLVAGTLAFGDDLTFTATFDDRGLLTNMTTTAVPK